MTISQQTDEYFSLLADCTLCPRNCHVNRLAGERGYCGQGADITAARAALHFWEEPCISGSQGAGAVFFSGCNLKCVYCQNYDISVENVGKALSVARLAQIFLNLQEKGAANIDLVTAGHFLPQVRLALRRAKAHSLSIPIVYNTGSYEKISSLRLLEGLVDIYLPDLKYRSPELSAAFSHAPDYYEHATAAIGEMLRQTGRPIFDENTGLMRRGVIVRHLVLPGQVRDSKKILRYLHDTYGNDIYVSILSQYTPMHTSDSVSSLTSASCGLADAVCSEQAISPTPASGHSQNAVLLHSLSRKVTEEEYARVLDFADKIGIVQGFIQEGDTAKKSFIPSFDGEGL